MLDRLRPRGTCSSLFPFAVTQGACPWNRVSPLNPALCLLPAARLSGPGRSPRALTPRRPRGLAEPALTLEPEEVEILTSWGVFTAVAFWGSRAVGASN